MTPEQHSEHMRLLYDIHNAVKNRPNLDEVYQISAVNAYVVDFRDRYHIFMWTANSGGLTLTVEDLGTFAVSANTWTNISFRQGMRIYAQGQANLVPILVRCTDSSTY